MAGNVWLEFRPVVAAIRKPVKESAPDAHEVISCLGFRQGASFADGYGLLRPELGKV